MADRVVVISGAGVAGLITAYWLAEHGFVPILIEKASGLRLGGHAVDLWGSAVEVVERMGALEELEGLALHNEKGTMLSSTGRRATIALNRISANIHPRHVEVMRSDLVGILAASVAARAKIVFGQEVRSIVREPDHLLVELSAGQRIEALALVGADGQHSRVRHLAFGPEARFSHGLGTSLATWSAPNTLGLEGHIFRYVSAGKTLVIYPYPDAARLAVIALYRSNPSGAVDWRSAVRERFADEGWPVQDMLAHLDDSDGFGDVIASIRMPTYPSSRVALVGDAGFAPGAAVGGGTGLAVVSGFALAQEMHRHGRAEGLTAYSRRMRPVVNLTSRIAPPLLDAIVPRSALAASATVALTPLIAALPEWLRNRLPLLPKETLDGLQAVANFSLEI